MRTGERPIIIGLVKWTGPTLALLGAAVALALLGLGALAGSAGAATATASSCVPATNIEAIIDDSGSMAETDPYRLRVQGLDLLIDTLAPSTYLGAVEFGSSLEGIQPAADSVFPPEPIGPNAGAMERSLEADVNADNGGTDYNAAFAAADAADPTSAARIFLTDGGHNVGPYTEAHLAHPVPTYVIGFAAALSTPEDSARLEKIAADTGGEYFPVASPNQLQAAMNLIGSSLTCQEAPQEFVDLLGQGGSVTHHIKVRPGTKKVRIAVTWANPGDSFTVSGFKVVYHHHVLRRRPKVRTSSTGTFLVEKVSRLHRGTLYFTVTATGAYSEPRVTVTTQVGRVRN
jgi:hypothetical protein